MKQIPFYPNREDGISCMLAAMRSVLEYLESKPYSWNDMEEITGFTGKPVWTAKIWSYIAARGYDVRMIEPFDYPRFADEGKAYLEQYLDPETLKWQLDNTDIMKLPEELPKFLKDVHQEVRSPQLSDLDKFLAEDYLVITTLNSRVLNQKPGFSSHTILIHGKIDGNYVANDPGLPPVENRMIEPSLLWEAMGGANNREEMTGVRRKGTNG